MRIDGFSPQSYPIKRKPGKGLTRVDDTVEDVEIEAEVLPEPPVKQRASASRTQSGSTNLPVRQQEVRPQGSVSSRVAEALASYLTTASFVDWDALDVEGLDLHV